MYSMASRSRLRTHFKHLNRALVRNVVVQADDFCKCSPLNFASREIAFGDDLLLADPPFNLRAIVGALGELPPSPPTALESQQEKPIDSPNDKPNWHESLPANKSLLIHQRG